MLGSGGTVSLVVGGLESSEKTHLTLGCMGTSRGAHPTGQSSLPPQPQHTTHQKSAGAGR